MPDAQDRERSTTGLLGVAHQWMTVIGFPALLVVGGLYWNTFTAKIDSLDRKVEALGSRIGSTETAIAVNSSTIGNHETRISRLEDRPIYGEEPRRPAPCARGRTC